ncbi:MAG: arylsulfatase [Acidobacteria bacterium]|nr:arylsulfatase [Acidobacteriota bacterium]
MRVRVGPVWWRLVGTLALLCCVGAPAAQSPAAPSRPPTTPAGRRPNIILIHADDLGWGDVSAYGQRRFRTPVLDRMAAEGVRFTHYYSGSTVCAPSRASLMTGLHTGHTRIRGNGDVPLEDAEVTIGEVLTQAGYRTATIGKWGLGDAGTTGQPDRQGFAEAFGYLRHTHPHRQYTDRLWKNGTWVEVSPTRDYTSDLFTDAAVDFIARDAGVPFFLYLAYPVPHAELRPPEEALAPWRGRFPETPFVNAKADAITPVPPYSPSGGYRSQPTPHAAFAAMVTRMDQQIGRVLATLRTRGLDRDTLVIFTSDNGPHREGGADPDFFDSNGPLRGIKRDLYEGGIRVPMIVRWPGHAPAGVVRDTVWAHWDVLPTLADIAGVAPPSGLDGQSMRAALTARIAPKAADRTLYWEFHERGYRRAARRGRWKTVWLDPATEPELYDLTTDPGEQHDVAATHADVVAQFREFFATARTPSERWPGAPVPRP